MNFGYYLGMVLNMKFLQQRKHAVTFLSLVLAGLAVQLAFLQPLMAEEPMNVTDINECRKIAAKAERLACYDTVSDGGVFNEQKLKETQVESFGSRTMPKDTETKVVTGTGSETTTETVSKPVTDISIDSLQVTVVRSQKNPNDIHYFQTSDGQVWKQQYAETWTIKVPFEAEIKSGVMGSFFLIPESGKSTRVKRVK